jgi:protein arginine kinase activator
MICQRCKENTATVHLTKIEQKKKLEFHLCEVCAEQQGVTSEPEGFSIQSFLSEVAEVEDIKRVIPTEEGPTPCPVCGMSFEAFRSSGRLGCPEDYEHFKLHLVPLIEKIHSSSQHVGKVPKRLSTRLDRLKLIANLKREQEKTIKDENYERAAELRDRIRHLEEEMGSSA